MADPNRGCDQTGDHCEPGGHPEMPVQEVEKFARHIHPRPKDRATMTRRQEIAATNMREPA
jgi:hypothetical protein